MAAAELHTAVIEDTPSPLQRLDLGYRAKDAEGAREAEGSNTSSASKSEAF